ncbi:MAG: hypothetical protein PHH13_04525 [Candidatus Peribacteraceae bacterium]|nr:hypothetical protein [Candidatus Peribacteraceae bacterium]
MSRTLLDPLVRFVTEDEGWQHITVICIAFLFCLSMHLYERWKDK